MSINLDSLSAKELDALISQAKKRKTTLSKRKPIAVVRKKLTQLAKAEGYSIGELFGGAAPAAPARAAKAPARKVSKNAGKSVAPKYRNPANPSETWAGRGKQPRWLAAQTSAGKKLEDFLIR
ncbi:H-NS histone family protein [Lysobacter soli]|jgi:DNA-binding protein H-NS|uniref:H-NS histone family protein n=1 Tax=Lysobacter soli TaxID=453783 RepID=A0A3D8VHK7_9GAMM|nr:H-NS histone family protein [Lysobacter soli]RDY68846.1 H-NS histone family protein [Lysobacter soli]